MGIGKLLKSLLGGSKLDVSKRFELEREAISGTMSRFYKARDRETGQTVGLKILDPKKTAAVESRHKGLEKPSEGEIAVKFDHPNIVKTHEHGITTDGAPYVVMEFLAGPGLNSVLIAREPFLDGRRLKYVRHAAEGLDAVHVAGFIHHDVCPRNYMLTGDGETLKLTDFGLTVPDTHAFRQPGNRTGVPDYMAPEVARRQQVDQRLDIFSFGITVYEMFTFELPWPRGTTGQAAMQHDQTPTDIRKHRPKIHPTLAEAIHACIEPEVKNRCRTMRRFLRTIESVEREDID